MFLVESLHHMWISASIETCIQIDLWLIKHLSMTQHHVSQIVRLNSSRFLLFIAQRWSFLVVLQHTWNNKIHKGLIRLALIHCMHTANILTVLSTAFGSVTFPTVIWLCMLPPKTAIDLKLYSSMSLSVIGTAVDCDNHSQRLYTWHSMILKSTVWDQLLFWAVTFTAKLHWET